MTKPFVCNFRPDYALVEQQWDLLLADYFAKDLKLLAPLAKDGLVDVDEEGVQVTAKGRLLIRSICMYFDTHLRQKARMRQFSRAIQIVNGASFIKQRTKAPSTC